MMAVAFVWVLLPFHDFKRCISGKSLTGTSLARAVPACLYSEVGMASPVASCHTCGPLSACSLLPIGYWRTHCIDSAIYPPRINCQHLFLKAANWWHASNKPPLSYKSLSALLVGNPYWMTGILYWTVQYTILCHPYPSTVLYCTAVPFSYIVTAMHCILLLYRSHFTVRTVI